MKKTYEKAICDRAKTVLGINGEFDENIVKYAYYRMMFLYHPDKKSGNPAAHEMAVLIGEAFQVLSGKTCSPLLLKRDDLVSEISKIPIEQVEGLLSYEDWLKKQFYNMDGKSIWAY